MFKIIFAFYLVPLIVILIRNQILFSKKQKMLDEYHDFSMKVLDWSKEINDQDKKLDLLRYHITYISTSQLEEVKLKWRKIPEFKKYIEDTWGSDITSLKKEIRDRKINDILEFKK